MSDDIVMSADRWECPIKGCNVVLEVDVQKWNPATSTGSLADLSDVDSITAVGGALETEESRLRRVAHVRSHKVGVLDLSAEVYIEFNIVGLHDGP